MRPSLSLFAVLAIVLTQGCIQTTTAVQEGPLFFEVEFTSSPEGLDPANPGSFSTSAVGYPIRVTAIGADREQMDWNGTVQVKATPGVIESGETVTLTQGQGTATVEIALAFDALRIWVSDEGDDTTPGSYASGVAPSIQIELPTVAQLQQPLGSDDASPLTHNYVPVKAFGDAQDPRELIVTSVLNDGFYVTDRSQEDGSFNSLFVFTFSRPDYVVPGARLLSLAGIVAEYIGYTEMQFPTYDVESTGHFAGEPSVLDPSIVCDDDLMEKWEASVVRIENLVSDFQQAAECEDYLGYGQWPARLPGTCGGDDARITVVNVNTVPSFAFPECEDNLPPPARELSYLVGILRHTAPADPPWIIDVRSCLDFPEADRPEDCDQLLERPLSGPRKAPNHFYRDLETCEAYPDSH
jgi:hypothetical protein